MKFNVGVHDNVLAHALRLQNWACPFTTLRIIYTTLNQFVRGKSSVAIFTPR